MRVLVAGGGIAGTVTAMALQRAGHEPVVFEARPTGGADAGAFLTVMHNGMDALRAIGADGPVVESSFAALGVELVGPDGATVSTRQFDTEGLAGPRTLTRAACYRALQTEAQRRGIAFEHGRRLVSVASGKHGVTATFADGVTASGAVLIGADGLHSVVRKLIDPAAGSPRFTGLTVVYGYTRAQGLPSAPGIYRMIRGTRAAFGFTTAPDGATFWFARIPDVERPRAELAAVTPAGWREFAGAAFAGDPLPCAEIIAATGDEVYGGHSYDLPETRRWSTSTMVLAGDSAHAASPAAGQGASMALEDAVVLGMCLRDLPDPAAAFAVYEGRRRARVEKLVAASAGQDVGEDRGWLYEHHLDWDCRINP
ncbi:2-polyprenyl-6-methoxyphenol hydroxylase-like FAD-dependent oxidoreductase [Amycolatopsis sulphurea]|uniref:2-polyprenyl-6-methoxyphenol hydroxylase-like FAD-dependent oxidoreductase n=1 Tax=Amycolatopsis sulphurea TaxID=76022 RepID=A0A2A9F752_9PSEU|nr:FAD-dependent monooxygenase [Amycolatopsis sulphurea]PFG46352.1 2-polyprenyl-6-methoxyphenol hydroxylase-like FAD-dependent oxidoreductase [Amycolatopsis sulphurea]